MQASQEALRLARVRYERGADSWLQVLDVQRTCEAARQGLVDLRQSQIANSIALYMALGGGAA